MMTQPDFFIGAQSLPHPGLRLKRGFPPIVEEGVERSATRGVEQFSPVNNLRRNCASPQIRCTGCL